MTDHLFSTYRHRGRLWRKSSETFVALDWNSTGVWLVTTQGSEHIWDLAGPGVGTYTRLPGPRTRGGRFTHDGVPCRILQVEQWPQIDGWSYLSFEDHADPRRGEQWRTSSTVDSIHRLVEVPDA